VRAKALLTFCASALLTLVPITNISADELPRELVLQCHGNTKLLVTRENNTEVQKDTFHLTLRLKDGSLGNIEYNFLEGKNCTLVDGSIRCELNTTTYNRKLDTTSKEHRSVAINRTTGEMNLILESQSFDGTNTTGEPTITVKSFRTGACHSTATSNGRP
jgi:hypothetical protein